MTNTNDFRRYSYQNDPVNLINSFSASRTSYAPKVRPQEQPDIRVREGAGIKSKAQLMHEQKLARRKIIRICAVAVISLAMIASVLCSLAVKNQLTREIARRETAIANAQSEYISLESELNSLVSISMIDKYAVEQLGMTKVRSNQIQYMDVNEFKEKRTKALEQKKLAAEKNQAAEKTGNK